MVYGSWLYGVWFVVYGSPAFFLGAGNGLFMRESVSALQHEPTKSETVRGFLFRSPAAPEDHQTTEFRQTTV
jgi:hypothetical protein